MPHCYPKDILAGAPTPRALRTARAGLKHDSGPGRGLQHLLNEQEHTPSGVGGGVDHLASDDQDGELELELHWSGGQSDATGGSSCSSEVDQ